MSLHGRGRDDSLFCDTILGFTEKQHLIFFVLWAFYSYRLRSLMTEIRATSFLVALFLFFGGFLGHFLCVSISAKIINPIKTRKQIKMVKSPPVESSLCSCRTRDCTKFWVNEWPGIGDREMENTWFSKFLIPFQVRDNIKSIMILGSSPKSLCLNKWNQIGIVTSKGVIYLKPKVTERLCRSTIWLHLEIQIGFDSHL